MTQPFYFRNNTALEISKEDIKEFNYKALEILSGRKLIQFDYSGFEPQFKISTLVPGFLDIEILDKDNMYLNFLINASRICWKEEYQGKDDEYLKANKFNIAGPALSSREQFMQKEHLINKIYAIGYLLCEQKDESKAWAVYAMDSYLTRKRGGSGTGKSIFVSSFENFGSIYFIMGRNKKVANDSFIYQGVTSETDYILVDDVSDELDLSRFLSGITGGLKIDKQCEPAYEIPFQYSPKFIFTGGHRLLGDGRPTDYPSAIRRFLYVVFSDYYSVSSPNNEGRRVCDDFEGKFLFKDFSEVDYQKFYSFCAQCVQFYLSHDSKINPPNF